MPQSVVATPTYTPVRVSEAVGGEPASSSGLPAHLEHEALLRVERRASASEMPKNAASKPAGSVMNAARRAYERPGWGPPPGRSRVVPPVGGDGSATARPASRSRQYASGVVAAAGEPARQAHHGDGGAGRRRRRALRDDLGALACPPARGAARGERVDGRVVERHGGRQPLAEALGQHVAELDREEAVHAQLLQRRRVGHAGLGHAEHAGHVAAHAAEARTPRARRRAARPTWRANARRRRWTRGAARTSSARSSGGTSAALGTSAGSASGARPVTAVRRGAPRPRAARAFARR
jgi:hypothetical protein